MEYREALLRAIEGWNLDPIPDEWLFEKFRKDVVGSMSSSEAFEAINETVCILINESDESTATEILQTVIDLAWQSGTTEVPNILLKYKSEVMERFASFGVYANGKLKELFKHYRI